ncbi:MAG: hypothetical protein ACJ76J_05225 [Thermoanaerobaculia bacterium]
MDFHAEVLVFNSEVLVLYAEVLDCREQELEGDATLLDVEKKKEIATLRYLDVEARRSVLRNST